jgi:hypothetical protein
METEEFLTFLRTQHDSKIMSRAKQILEDYEESGRFLNAKTIIEVMRSSGVKPCSDLDIFLRQKELDYAHPYFLSENTLFIHPNVSLYDLKFILKDVFPIIAQKEKRFFLSFTYTLPTPNEIHVFVWDNGAFDHYLYHRDYMYYDLYMRCEWNNTLNECFRNARRHHKLYYNQDFKQISLMLNQEMPKRRDMPLNIKKAK